LNVLVPMRAEAQKGLKISQILTFHSQRVDVNVTEGIWVMRFDHFLSIGLIMRGIYDKDIMCIGSTVQAAESRRSGSGSRKCHMMT
jgi:hypothetical protein